MHMLTFCLLLYSLVLILVSLICSYFQKISVKCVLVNIKSYMTYQTECSQDDHQTQIRVTMCKCSALLQTFCYCCYRLVLLLFLQGVSLLRIQNRLLGNEGSS